jgi:hypothetical protein
MIGVGLALAALVAVLPLIGNVAPFAVPVILTAVLAGSWWMTSVILGRRAAALLTVAVIAAFVKWHEVQGIPVPRDSACDGAGRYEAMARGDLSGYGTGHVCE